MLEEESNRSSEIADLFDWELGFLQELILYATSLLKESISPPDEMSALSITHCIGLFVKVCRLARGNLGLAELGQSECADILCRSIFEASCAFAFLARAEIKLTDSSSNPPVLLPTFGKTLSYDFRASLYEFHWQYELERMLGGFENSDHSEAAMSLRHAIDASAAHRIELEALVGQDWIKLLRTKKSFSGTSFRNLALSIGPAFASEYVGMYRAHSWRVHGCDASLFTEYSNETQGLQISWQSENEDIASALGWTIGPLLLTTRLYIRRFVNSYENDLRLHQFLFDWQDRGVSAWKLDQASVP
jgi:hypothetical protein